MLFLQPYSSAKGLTSLISKTKFGFRGNPHQLIALPTLPSRIELIMAAGSVQTVAIPRGSAGKPHPLALNNLERAVAPRAPRPCLAPCVGLEKIALVTKKIMSFRTPSTARARAYRADSAILGQRAWRKLLPWGIEAPKFSAMVCPMSARVSRTPRFAPRPLPGE